MYTKHLRKVWCNMKPSGIGGQAVIEGIMMRNKNNILLQSENLIMKLKLLSKKAEI